MKLTKRLGVLMLVVIMCFALCVSAFAGTGHYYKHRVTATAVNLRSEPSVSSTSYGLVYYNEIFWCQLDERYYNNNTFSFGQPDSGAIITQAYGHYVPGYISNSYLRFDDPLKTPEVEA